MHFYLMCALCKLSTSGYPYVIFCYSRSKVALCWSYRVELDGMEELWLLYLRASISGAALTLGSREGW